MTGFFIFSLITLSLIRLFKCKRDLYDVPEIYGYKSGVYIHKSLAFIMSN